MSRSTVKHELTPERRTERHRTRHRNRPRRMVENDDYAAFTRRILAAHGRRIAAGDIEGLTTLAALAADIDHAPDPGRDRAAHPRLLLDRNRHPPRDHPTSRAPTLGTGCPMTTSQPRAANDPAEDVDSYLRHNLMLVQTGRRDRAPGIRRCTDCHEPWIDDHTGLSWCRTCRTTHRRRCEGCHALIAITTDGDRLCDCCQQQTGLFPAPVTGDAP